MWCTLFVVKLKVDGFVVFTNAEKKNITQLPVKGRYYQVFCNAFGRFRAKRNHIVFFDIVTTVGLVHP